MVTRAAAAPICCDRGSSLSALIRRVPATVVAVRRIAAAELFPSDLADALRALPYDVCAVVATTRAAAEVGVPRACLGEVLVFVRTSLLARMPDALDSGAARLVALLHTGLSPWLGPDGAAWDRDDDSSAYTLSARRIGASFVQEGVAEGWEHQLSDPPDRTGRA